ncbi:BTB/POZ domain-containing protein 6-like isoform X1 [Mytilus californianus]|uniref:BTB/POZ domain-containing protein 6-like isoform X1 n=2 Tax=Mytilus californianus TaxID=6549 RepID=UPI0022479FC9|nr:BTB/POZ domain-containing protein 6-like isoform X1 [Mytilus californianus]
MATESPKKEETMSPPYDWQATKCLAECNKHMLANQIACDVGFLVGDEQELVMAHKYVMISRSCVFYAMLHGLMAENADEYISIPDIDKETFKQMLEFIYSDDVKIDTKTAASLLYAARKYGLNGLEDKCTRALEHGILGDNVCFILDQAYKFDNDELKKKCLDFIFHQPKIVLKSSSFCDLAHQCVFEIISSNELDAEEDAIFEAVMRWSEIECLRQEMMNSSKNQRKVLGRLMYQVRFPLMNEAFFNKTVIQSDLLTRDEIIHLRNFFTGKEKHSKHFMTTKRVTGENLVLHWRFGPVSCIHNEETAISFSSSIEILVEGVRVDCSIFEDEFYDADLSLFDVNNKEMARTKRRIDVRNKSSLVNVTFHAAPKIDKGYKHTIILKVQGSHGYYGASGRSNLQLHGSVPTCVNPEGDFTKVIMRKDQVPAILVRPVIRS